MSGDDRIRFFDELPEEAWRHLMDELSGKDSGHSHGEEIRSSASLLRDENRLIIGAVATFREVTKWKSPSKQFWYIRGSKQTVLRGLVQRRPDRLIQRDTLTEPLESNVSKWT